MARTKLTPEEKAARKLDRKAADMNGRAAREFGPLFAHLAPTYTRDDAYWHTRANYSRGAELVAQSCGPAMTAMRMFQLNVIEQFARSVLGVEAFDKLAAHSRRTYRNQAGYGYSFWCGVLTERTEIAFAWERFDDATTSLGYRLKPSDSFPPVGYVPPLTRAEFFERFPYIEFQNSDEPDDGGLFARVMAIADSMGGN